MVGPLNLSAAGGSKLIYRPHRASAGFPQLHLINHPAPIYPPIGRAAHVSGTVNLQIEIGPDGHIVSGKVLDGPEMVEGAAIDAIRKWLYAPVLVDGKAVSVITTVSILFDPNAPPSQYSQPSAADAQDRKLDFRFRSLKDACAQSLASKTAAPSKQVELCQKTADLADQFSQGGATERLSAYTYLSTAFRNNKQLPEALSSADKAVTAVHQGFLCCAQASAAYSVRAEAEAQLGKLAEASEDLTIAENEERSMIARSLTPSNKAFDKMNQSFARSNYIPVLKGLLLYHAHILTALSKPSEAAEKKAEADKL